MRLLPGVRYENTVDSLGMSFGTSVPNVGGARRDWSNVIVDGVVAQRGRQQRPDGAADQPRRDRRGPRAAEFVPRRVRPRRRRPGADRQQERELELPRQPLSLRPQRGAQRQQLLQQPIEHQEAAVSLQHLRRQPRRPGSGLDRRRQEAVLLLLPRSAAGQPAGAGAQLDDADRSPRCRETSRRRSTARAG